MAFPGLDFVFFIFSQAFQTFSHEKNLHKNDLSQFEKNQSFNDKIDHNTNLAKLKITVSLGDCLVKKSYSYYHKTTIWVSHEYYVLKS